MKIKNFQFYEQFLKITFKKNKLQTDMLADVLCFQNWLVDCFQNCVL